MGNFCACIITTSPQIMPPQRVLPIHTNSITQPLHTVHTCHVSATFGVSIYCVREGLMSHRADVTPRAPCAQHGQHPHMTPCSLAYYGCQVWQPVGRAHKSTTNHQWRQHILIPKIPNPPPHLHQKVEPVVMCIPATNFATTHVLWQKKRGGGQHKRKPLKTLHGAFLERGGGLQPPAWYPIF